MIEVSEKFVYDITSTENFYGMIPLDWYVSYIYFNFDSEKYNNILMNFSELSNFLTECLVEFFSRRVEDYKDFNPNVIDFYVSGSPSGTNKAKLSLVISYDGRKFLVSEQKNKYYSDNSSFKEFRETSNLNISGSIKLVTTVHLFALTTIQKIAEKCKNAKNILLTKKCEPDEKEELEKEENKEKSITDAHFDLRNYEKI